ncbi:Uncharacterised protein [Providencia stuartii]|nr:Uncharacterised protein [Providencia stuartii]
MNAQLDVLRQGLTTLKQDVASQRDTLRTVTAQLAVAGKPDEQIAVLSDGAGKTAGTTGNPPGTVGTGVTSVAGTASAGTKNGQSPGCQGKNPPRRKLPVSGLLSVHPGPCRFS